VGLGIFHGCCQLLANPHFIRSVEARSAVHPSVPTVHIMPPPFLPVAPGWSWPVGVLVRAGGRKRMVPGPAP
jgi:hypothetical protein